MSVLEYQRPDATLTLAEGLREYYASREGLAQGRGLSPAAREFFRCHDAAHVVFGCSTSLPDEAIVKLWSFFGTTAGLGLLRDYRLPESQEIYEGLDWGEIASTAIRSVVLAPRVLWRCLRMRKRWPWSDFEHHRDVPLLEIRREYGIRPLLREYGIRPLLRQGRRHRIDPGEYRRLELRAHTLLADIPLHDVWAVDLPGEDPSASILDVRALLTPEAIASVSRPVRWLFGLRAALGRMFRWDQPGPEAPEPRRLHPLPEADRSASLVPPGTPDGPFVSLYVSPRESISEIRNATVHAFSVLALAEAAGGHRLYWAIYVEPVGPITRRYMALIDPFRRLLIYPAVLRYVRSAWLARERGPAETPRSIVQP